MKREFFSFNGNLIVSTVCSGWTNCLKLSPNLHKKAKVCENSYSFDCVQRLSLKIRKGIEYPANYDPELDKLAQELARTTAGDLIQDGLYAQSNSNED